MFPVCVIDACHTGQDYPPVQDGLVDQLHRAHVGVEFAYVQPVQSLRNLPLPNHFHLLPTPVAAVTAGQTTLKRNC